MKHLKIIDPLRFPGMQFEPLGAVEHPILGPVDIYCIEVDSWASLDMQAQGTGVECKFLGNNAKVHDASQFGLKIFKKTVEVYPSVMVDAYRSFLGQQAAAKVGAAPPVHRMIWVMVKYKRLVAILHDEVQVQKEWVIDHYWGYSVSRCAERGGEMQGMTDELKERLLQADFSHIPRTQDLIGETLGPKYRPGKFRFSKRDIDAEKHNCGLWQGNLVLFDFGMHFWHGLTVTR